MMHIRHSPQASYRGGISPTNLLLGSLPGKRRPIRNSEELFQEGVNFARQQAKHRVNCSGLCGLACDPSPEDWGTVTSAPRNTDDFPVTAKSLLQNSLHLKEVSLPKTVPLPQGNPISKYLQRDANHRPPPNLSLGQLWRHSSPITPHGIAWDCYACVGQSASPSSGQLLLPSLLHRCCLWEHSSINFRHTNLHLRVCFLETQSNLAKSKPWLNSTLNLLHAWTHATENSWRENIQASQLVSSYIQAHMGQSLTLLRNHSSLP